MLASDNEEEQQVTYAGEVQTATDLTELGVLHW